MADAEDSPGSTTSIFLIGDSEPEPESSDHFQSLNSISQWCDSEDPNCNPFAPSNSGGDWLADSDSDRDMSCFITDLFERGGHSSEHQPDLGGLRIADFESESDCEEIRPDERRFGLDEFDWEEIEESESPAIPIEAEEIETMLEAVERFEWEIMMAINTLASLEQDDHGGDPLVRAPAEKGFVESLAVVSAEAAEELGKDGGACAVCKDRVSASGGTVNRLPCSHYFHSDCIVPWLGIKNTCPVCRFEVPTDYDRTKRSRFELFS